MSQPTIIPNPHSNPNPTFSPSPSPSPQLPTSAYLAPPTLRSRAFSSPTRLPSSLSSSNSDIIALEQKIADLRSEQMNQQQHRYQKVLDGPEPDGNEVPSKYDGSHDDLAISSLDAEENFVVDDVVGDKKLAVNGPVDEKTRQSRFPIKHHRKNRKKVHAPEKTRPSPASPAGKDISQLPPVAQDVSELSPVVKDVIQLSPALKDISQSSAATKDISHLSPAELKALSDPSLPHVEIAVWDPTASDTKPQIIHDFYPLALLTAMSPKIARIMAKRDETLRANFNDTASKSDIDTTKNTSNSTTNTRQTSSFPAPPTGITLHSSAPTTLTKILTYTHLASTHSTLYSPFATSQLSIPLSNYAFHTYSLIHRESIYLQFTLLQHLMMKKLQTIAKGQVHSNDFERILATIPPPPKKESHGKRMNESNWIRTLALQSIINAMRDGRLQYSWKYAQIFRKYPESAEEVGARVGRVWNEVGGGECGLWVWEGEREEEGKERVKRCFMLSELYIEKAREAKGLVSERGDV